MRICFWNIYKKAPPDLIGQLVTDLNLDILVLAESITRDEVELSPNALESIRRMHRVDYRLVQPRCDCIRVLTGLADRELTIEIDTDKRWVTFSVRAERYTPFLLTCCHHFSQQGSSPARIAEDCQMMLTDIQTAENLAGHHHTVVVGDFNLQPWDQGLAGVKHLNAVMTKSLASKGSRHYRDKDYAYFYNPMWGHFGDAAGDPPASYYDKRSEPDKIHWNMFDQVLVRPAMLPFFAEERLRILRALSSRSLLRNHRPDREAVSDHLPVYFEISPREREESFHGQP